MTTSEPDPRYLAWVRRQPCAASHDPSGHEGRIEAHHDTRGRCVGRKADDSTAIPLCTRHHRLLHDCHGSMGMAKIDRWAWSDQKIAEHRALYLATPPDRGGPLPVAA